MFSMYSRALPIHNWSNGLHKLSIWIVFSAGSSDLLIMLCWKLPEQLKRNNLFVLFCGQISVFDGELIMIFLRFLCRGNVLSERCEYMHELCLRNISNFDWLFKLR